MSRDKSSYDSLRAATESRASFTGREGTLGAAGYVSDTDDNSYQFLGTTGQTDIFNPQDGGYGRIRIGAAWQPLIAQKKSLFGMKKRTIEKPVDLDLGCLYELHNGQRGCVQAFGDLYGDFDEAPYMLLDGDDRSGEDHDDDEGEDEVLRVNGQKWPEIKRLLLYLYIYDGAQHWAQIKPQIQIQVPNEKPMIVQLHTFKSELAVCAVAGLENVRNGIKLTNYTEYYPGHAEMDRAFGFGIQWEDGQKD